MSERKKHPSGRPIRKDGKRGLPVFRNPGVGPYVPRLQQPDRVTNAVGFHRFVIKDDEDE